jgi:predicted nucleotidyltransferase
MSKVKLNAIWQHDKVLPYLLNDLKQKIEAITPVKKMYLFGSRARTPMKEWNKLAGKDWDILVICNFPIENTELWTSVLNYHIDLVITNPQKEAAWLANSRTVIELYPNNLLPAIETI